MIPGPATFLPFFHAAIHLVIGAYFFVGLFRRHSAGAKVFFFFCCLAMIVFVYHDLFGYPPIP
jgi:hypothetical protein